MSDQGIDCGDLMGLVDRIHHAFNSVMSLRTEMMTQEDKVDEKIKNLSQEVNSLARQVKEMRKILLRQDDDVSNFIDNEAVEVDSQGTEDSQDSDEVIFVGATWVSNKKRRLE